MDLATLGIKVDSREVKQGTSDLDKLTAAGGRAEGSTTGLATATRHLGTAMAALGIAGVGVTLTKLTRDTMAFQDAMAEVSTLVDEARFSMGELSKAAQEQAKLFGTSATEQAKAQYQIISAGASSAAQATETLTAANRLAVGGVTDVKTAADGLTSVLNAYGPAAGTATQVSDALFVAMRAGKTTIGELSDNLGKVAPLAASAGVSFDELAASVSALTKGGISTTEAVTGVRAILAAVAKPTDEAAKMAERLGINFTAAGLKAQGFGGFLDEVVSKTGGSQEAMAQLFGGIEALVPVLALAGQAGADFDTIMGDMATKAGQTETAFNKIAESPGFKWNQMVSAFSVEAMKLGTALLSVLVPAMTAITSNFETVVDVAGAAVTGMVAYKVATIATAAANTLMGGSFGIVAATVATTTSRFGLMAGAQVALAATTAGLSAALRVLLASLGPIGLALTAAGVAYTLLSDNTQKAAVASDEYRRQIDALQKIQNKTSDATNRLATATGQARKEILANAQAVRQETLAYLANAKAALESARAKASEAKADLTRDIQFAITSSRPGGPDRLASSSIQRSARETTELKQRQAEANKVVVAAQKELARLDKIIAEASKPVAALSSGIGDLSDSTAKAGKTAADASAGFKSFLEGLQRDLRNVGKTEDEIKALDVAAEAAAADNAGFSSLAKSIREFGAALAYASDQQRDKDFIKALTEETSKIGKTEKELRLMAVATQVAAAANEDLAKSIQDASDAREKAFGTSATAGFVREMIEPAEQQIALLGLEGIARERVALEMEVQSLRAKQLAGDIDVSAEAIERYYQTSLDLLDGESALDAQARAARDLLDALSAVAEQSAVTGQMMYDAFGNIGGVFGDLIANISEYSLAREEMAQAVIKGNISQENADKRLATLEARNTAMTISGVKSLFKEKSTAYKVLTAIEMAYAAMQAVNTVRSIAMDSAKTASSVANSGARAAADGIAAVAKAIASLPFPLNLAAGAATAAALVAFGVKMTGGGGGGSVPTPPTAEELQESAGTGSVLGDALAKSDSIARSLDLVAENTNRDLQYSNDMLNALRSIDTSIAKLAGTVARQVQVSGSLFDTSGARLGQSGNAGFLGLFSSSTSRTLFDLGVNLGSASVASIIENGINGSTYQTIEQIKKKSGFLGIGGGTKTTYQTTTGALDSDIIDAISDVVQSLRDGLVTASSIIGLEGAEAILNSFQVNIGKISFKDMTGEEIENQLNAIFSKVGDDMAGTLLPGLRELQLIGEGLFETFIRVAKEYEAVDYALQSIGRSFGMVGLESVAARSALVGLFGGLEEFIEGTEFFRDQFLTEAQQIAPIQTALIAELQRLGMAGITTREQFRDTVLGLDLTTQAGREMYAALLNVAPAFDKVSDYFEDINETAKKALESTAQRFTAFAESLKKYRDTLFAPDAAQGGAYAALRARFNATAALAATGDASALGGLENAGKAFLDASRNNASSQQDYLRDVAVVARGVDAGIFAAEETADYAQLQLDALLNATSILQQIADNTAVVPQPTGTAPAGSDQSVANQTDQAMLTELREMRRENSEMRATLLQMQQLWQRFEGDGLTVKTDADTPILTQAAS